MPAGKVNSGDFRKGTPIVLPHQFGNLVGQGDNFGNVIPQANATLDSNPVTWLPSPTHFGNTVEFSLQSVPPVVIVAQDRTGTVDINLTQLLDSPTATLTYSGAPTGVTIAFGTNPDTGTSVATITVGSSVPAGKYTITIVGTGASETNTTNIHLYVQASSTPPPPAGITLVAGAFASKAAAAGGFAVTSPIDTTGADLLVVAISYLFANAAAPTDTYNNTWHALTTYSLAGTGFTTIWYAYNPTVGTGHTFTAQSTGQYPCISVAGFAGANTTSAVFEVGTDSGAASGSSAPIHTGSVAAASIGDLYIATAGGYVDGSVTVDSSFTVLAQDGAGGQDIFGSIAYLIATSTSPVNPAFTYVGSSFSQWSAAIAAFAHA
jgi:hypothetical protein